MMTRIKICGMTRAEDALTAAELGAHAIGLVFYAKSPRYVSIERAREIASCLPPFVAKVALFVNAVPSEIEQVLSMVRPDYLQFHGDEAPEFCQRFAAPYLKALRVKAETDLLQYARRFASASALLLDAYVEGVPGGTGTRFDWNLIPRALPLPVVLSGGLDARNVATAIEQVRPWAVDVSSGVEAAKGIKDKIKMAEFIKRVRDADLRPA
jgi:phosphoribosylanthranilate isomerase